jgi:redox-sensitive bicupin YhaK (pirin superfamily)
MPHHSNVSNGPSASNDSNVIVRVEPLGQRWQTHDPFLFCVHHVDLYPAGNDQLGPKAPLTGRDIGQDFEGKNGWRMYHGDVVPGFPQHPHRGFETVTIVRKGYIDHSDSLGATARFGMGDVQWLTAGSGVVHSEMFPLLDPNGPNTLELFQLWLNLPAKSKMVPAYFTMFWNEDIPHRTVTDANGKRVEVTVIAGMLDGVEPLSPPPHSWGADPDADLAIWSIAMEEGAIWTIPPARGPQTVRTLHQFSGPGLTVDGREIPGPAAVQVRSARPVTVGAGRGPIEILLLQGRPIGEPVAQYGPFVMNTRAELEQAFQDYRRTQFGGWPFPDSAPVHPRKQGRFARHADGRVEYAERQHAAR